MREAARLRSTTKPTKRSGLLTGISRNDERLEDNLLKLRAVLIFSASRWGTKKGVAASLVHDMKRHGLRASVRSIYRWQLRHRCDGPDGIPRRRRCDRGSWRRFTAELRASTMEAARLVCRLGDIAREWRRLRPGVSYETFRVRVRRLQERFRCCELAKGVPIGLF